MLILFSVLMAETIEEAKHLFMWDIKYQNWAYDLPDPSTPDWGSKFPDANGNQQSPINLNSNDAIYDEKLENNPLQVNYINSRETDILNNGNMLVVYPRYRQETGTRMDVPPKAVISGGPFFNNEEYELSEIRFHWGRENSRGSEHTVNLKAFPMEIQMVHFNNRLFSSVEEAFGKRDGVAITALFVQLGKENAGLKQITEHIEDVLTKGKQKTITTSFNPSSILPDPMLRDFWTYSGSLTFPPCSQNVTWIIYRYPLVISHAQVEDFRRLRSYSKEDKSLALDDGSLVDNFRPTQPLNERVVSASFL